MTDEKPTELPPSTDIAPKKYRGGWKKGQSGNPKGRPMTGYSTAEQIRAACVEDLPAVIAKVVQCALAGDMNAAKLIMTMCVAPLKPVEAPVEMPAIAASATLTQQGAAILQGVADGKLAPSQAASLLMGLASQARVTEIDDMLKRMAAIEQQLRARVS